MHHYVVRKWKYYLSSHVWLFATPWTVTRQAPLSMEFSRQEYWSGLPFPSPGIFLIPESSSGLLHCRWTLCYMNHRGSSPKVIPIGKFPKKFWVMSANFESNIYHHFVCSQIICFIFYKLWKQVERQKLVLSDQTFEPALLCSLKCAQASVFVTQWGLLLFQTSVDSSHWFPMVWTITSVHQTVTFASLIFYQCYQLEGISTPWVLSTPAAALELR